MFRSFKWAVLILANVVLARIGGLLVALAPQQRFRLVGVGLSNFFEPEDLSAQAALFE